MAKKKKSKTPARARSTRRAPRATPDSAAATTPDQRAPFTVVGVGASAGGLDAFSQFLKALPPDTGFAYVLISHLAPDHSSALPEILSRVSSMPVRQVEDHPVMAPDHVYVIPPGADLVVSGGRLSVTQRKGHGRAIDHFFTSLAEECGYRCIGVVLSGTSNDGTAGLAEIRAAGGLTFAQDDTAQHGAMPRAAIAAGHVDFILPPDEIALEIARIASHPLVAGAAPASEESLRVAELGQIIDLLRDGTDTDFSGYKKTTLLRRIHRRMVLHKLGTLSEYIRFIRKHPRELESLFHDVLISVTRFFRNPESFEALREKVLPRLAEGRTRAEQIRVWVLGCSTGEEAYSIAILLAEFGEQLGRPLPYQVFATDLNGAGIERARAGLYPQSIAEDVAPDRLRRFFLETDGHYRVSKTIRERVIFAQHNVLSSPPFSHIDMVSCRNLLIYLDASAQQRLIPVLHYALRPGGYLWLGNSETIGSYRDFFELEDPKHKIYRKRNVTHAPVMSFGQPYAERRPPRGGEAPSVRAHPVPVDPQREAERVLLNRYAPAGVLVNAEYEVLQFRGDTGRYLAPAPGRASLHLPKLLREGLLVPVRNLLERARRDAAAVRAENIAVKTNGGYHPVNIEVIPVPLVGQRGGAFLVLFEEADRRPARSSRSPARVPGRAKIAERESRSEAARLSAELAATREYLQSVIEQQEAANEELQSANEEAQSANEELQSINEELQTSKEEIQSSNEELATVNDELQARNVELMQSNNDFINLLNSVQLAIVMLGLDLRIRRFTPMAEKLLNLLPTDVGRPLTDLKMTLSTDLEPLLTQVIETMKTHEEEVVDRGGRLYSLRIRPYRTMDNRIDGAVIILVDVDDLRRGERAIVRMEAHDRAEAAEREGRGRR